MASRASAGDERAGDGGNAGVAAPDGGRYADGGAVEGRDSGAVVVASPYGLDERPANPTCVAPEPPPAGELDLRLDRVFEDAGDFDQPIYYLEKNGRSYVVEKPGRVRTFTGSGTDASTFVDIRSLVDDGPGEAGLLGMAFDPNFDDNGFVYLSYTTQDGGLTSHISRFVSRDGGLTLDPAPRVLLRQPQFAGNHNGGWIGFGPDDYLYIAFGDGGGGGDPRDHGQNPRTFLGSILRIDVSAGDPYRIPSDNPFADGNGGAPEVFAWGVRNPWRVSFDRLTGDLWGGDVGQGELEEVDLFILGGNYGWNIREGDRCFRGGGCDTDGLIDPVTVYGRGDGRSITGGYVYRGSELPELLGSYVFGDFASGRIWGLFEDEEGNYERRRLLDTSRSIASFGEDEAGELYLVDIGGAIFRFASDEDRAPSDFPQRLSETGCMNATDPSRPGPMLIPYAPSAPLWSDGATKERWFAIPDDTVIELDDDGDFLFPAGTVLVKQFRRDGRLLETRSYLHHRDGGWAGYTYRWNDDQTDALLLPGAGAVEVGDNRWDIPSRTECQQCHTEAANRSLGLELAQLNAAFTYPTGRRANQLATLEHIGVLGDLPAELPTLPPYEDSMAEEVRRARGYLHSNCSNCHRPGAPGRGDLDLRYFVPLQETGVCDEPELDDFDLDDARVVAPGASERSVLLHRMLDLGAGRMPPVGSRRVDPEGTGLIESWIRNLESCP